ncbi:MAG: hypothetical protein ACT4OS_10445 [Acidimicrobiales bacterium]
MIRVVTRIRISAPVIARLLPNLRIVLPVTARLETSAGVPVVGRAVNVRLGSSVICSGTTNSTGRVSCTATLGFNSLIPLVVNGISVDFAGNSSFGPSSARISVRVTA